MRSVFARLVCCGGFAVLFSASAVLLGSPAAASASGRPSLHAGASGFWVGVAQRDLNLVGYRLQDTGYYGPGTKTQVGRFRRNHGLHRVGGIGPRAWHELVKQVKHEQSIRFRPAHLNSRGLAVAPRNAPAVVKHAIAAANRIAFRPYCYGGGHGSWASSCYDCSGSVSYALHGGGLLWSPMAYSGFYGFSGMGKWMTIYANHTHVYMRLDGLWFDTADQSWGSFGHGDRWSRTRVDPAAGYIMRHPPRL